MPDPTPLKASFSMHATGAAVVVAVGDIGYHDAPALRTVIREAYDRKPKALVVNLEGEDYMATPGLATHQETDGSLLFRPSKMAAKLNK